MTQPFHSHTTLDELIILALQEDIGSGDKTTAYLIDPRSSGKAAVIAKEELTLAGSEPFVRVFQLLNPQVACTFLAQDGAVIPNDSVIAELEGPFNALLTGERTGLNFLQHLSGIATLTAHFVEKIKPYGVELLDTRKTTPGLRMLEKAAVHSGGGTNHRIGLFDGILIKENHIAACGGITEAVKKAKAVRSPLDKIEVEIRSIEELIEALESGPDMVMLDNMSVEEIRKAVEITGGSILLEVSGNITIDNVEEIAQTGINYISVGAITHSAKACDISMYIQNE